MDTKDTRQAGWTPGSRGDGARASALWGKRTGGVARAVLLALVIALCAPMAAMANTSSTTTPDVFVAPSLLQAIAAKPNEAHKVIVKANPEYVSAELAAKVNAFMARKASSSSKVKRQFDVINGISATLTGYQIKLIDALGGKFVQSIVPDYQVAKADLLTGVVNSLQNTQVWPQTVQADPAQALPNAPTIAIVDSGIDASHQAFAGRVLADVKFGNDSAGDSRGHGTMVASLAAGAAPRYAGASPTSKVVSLDVLGADGSGSTSDVIAAADWILQNKDAYGIKVANFSLVGATEASVMFDPLNAAVEKLWLNGVVVVAAAGNYGTGSTPSGVRSAPANDPFVITVGAADTNNTATPADDFSAPWSAYGYTHDGVVKPDLGAPGRYMNAVAPTGSTMYGEFTGRVVEPGYMWMSGTSFAAPVVAGVAAQILAAHPEWTPDQVKGALMLTAASPASRDYSLGVGIVQAQAAAAVVDPPNPNAALNDFVVADASGMKTFESASWASTAQENASWASASWASASWASASWASASWASASWASASWASASWASASWASASWASASWASASWASASWANSSSVE
jgi:serine protease AprX